MGVLYLIGVKQNFWKIFHIPDEVFVVQALTRGFLENLIKKNTFWPNYFYKKILLCSIHMAWSLGKVLDQGEGV